MGCSESKAAPPPPQHGRAPAPARAPATAAPAPAAQPQTPGQETRGGGTTTAEASPTASASIDVPASQRSNRSRGSVDAGPVACDWICVAEGGKIKFTADEQSLTVVRGLDEGVILRSTGVTVEKEEGTQLWVEVHAVGGKGWVLARRNNARFYVKAGEEYEEWVREHAPAEHARETNSNDDDAGSDGDLVAVASALELNHTATMRREEFAASRASQLALTAPLIMTGGDAEVEHAVVDLDENSPCAPPLSPGVNVSASPLDPQREAMMFEEADARWTPPPIAPHIRSHNTASSSSQLGADGDSQQSPVRGFSHQTLTKLRQVHATPDAPPLPIEYDPYSPKTLPSASVMIDLDGNPEDGVGVLGGGGDGSRRRTIAVGESPQSDAGSDE